jgi:pseudaminic acid biosynthesis-associated methylase
MTTITRTWQLDMWKGNFGKEYTERNLLSAAEADREYEKGFGIKKTDLYSYFLPPQLLSAGRVLEVGCNIGNSLRNLQRVKPGLSFYGVEPMAYAVAIARKLNPDMVFLHGTAFALPFQRGNFDLVMTNGVLIHIHPSDLPVALAEIYRCTCRYIFFHEYFAESKQEVIYGGHSGLLWKMNYQESFQKQFPDLECMRVHYLHYPDPATGKELTDQVCLLGKRPAKVVRGETQ